MRIPSELKQLSRLFPKNFPLYLVGGAVRDNFLKIQSTDYDVASALTCEQIKLILSTSIFKVCGEYPRTGTLVIMGKRTKYEYTTFRTDSYPAGRGDHAPQTVTFTEDIYADALRRDFTCNAIYYDILNDSYIDPTDGMSAIKDRLIVTTRQPDKVLQEDALRILRTARLSCELGFHAQPEVIESARAHVDGLKHIARERIGTEVLKILRSRHKYIAYKEGFKPSYGLALLSEMGANEIIWGQNLSSTTLLRLDALHENGYYAYNTTMQLALLMLDFSSESLSVACNNLALSKAIIAEIIKIIEGYRAIAAVNLNELSYVQAKLTVAKIYDSARPITALRMACGEDIERLCDIYHVISNLGLPTNVGMLKVNGNDVIAAGYKGTNIGKVLDYVLEKAIAQEIIGQDEQMNLIQLYGEKHEYC